MEYYARSTNGNPPYQLLIEHLNETAELAGTFCEKFTTRKIGEICGMYHDVGKYSDAFQDRIRGSSIRVDHSTAGAKLFALHTSTEQNQVSALAYTLLQYVIAGHHAGLPDHGTNNSIEESTLYRRLEACKPELYDAWQKELIEPLPSLADSFTQYKYTRETIGFFFFLYTHFIFSSLVDADRTSAANFPVPHTKEKYPSLENYLAVFETYMKQFSSGKESELNTIRNSIRNNCDKAADFEPGMFTLTVPTGGGKTLSSLSFALRHAVKNNLDRIIYTIPFTSIIEQNASVYKKIFGEKNVLEHHSNFSLPPSLNISETEVSRLGLAAANWEVPMILTTNVQFFESIFSANPSRARKVHNIANSVIILDEVQALPNGLLRPCLAALCELVTNYHCSVVLCTATQPDFEKNGLLTKNIHSKDIVPNYQELSVKMKRADAEFIGTKTVSEISKQLLQHQQVLCIVNTKKHALKLYNKIRMEGTCYHLSTNMYPAHRKRIIAEIRKCLNEGKPCRVISTQLIEAGVDIDFPTVYRSLAGVDSIIQAAGRCNREGKLPVGNVYVFEPAERDYLGGGYLRQTAEITGTFKTDLDLLSSAAAEKYFADLFDYRKTDMDNADILKACNESAGCKSYQFHTISDNFKMIADAGTAVIIPTPEALKILADLNDNNLGKIQRKITSYCVNVRENLLDTLFKLRIIRVESSSLTILSSLEYYDDETGLNITIDTDR